MGGIKEIMVTMGDRFERANGISPVNKPTSKPITALIRIPKPIRYKLAVVSSHKIYLPVRLSSLNAKRSTALLIWLKLGSSLSFGFSANLTLEASQ